MDQYVRENDLVEEENMSLAIKWTEKELYWVVTGYALMILAFWPHFIFPVWALVAKGLFYLFSLRKNRHVKLHVKRALLTQVPVSVFSIFIIFIFSTNLSGEYQGVFGVRGLLILGVLFQIVYLVYSIFQVKKVVLESRN